MIHDLLPGLLFIAIMLPLGIGATLLMSIGYDHDHGFNDHD